MVAEGIKGFLVIFFFFMENTEGDKYIGKENFLFG